MRVIRRRSSALDMVATLAQRSSSLACRSESEPQLLSPYLRDATHISPPPAPILHKTWTPLGSPALKPAIDEQIDACDERSRAAQKKNDRTHHLVDMGHAPHRGLPLEALDL